ALTVHAGGDFVDPYFATKALIAAEEAGLNVDGPARRWIAWLLPRQRPDGRFERYCRADGAWRSCADADADDALSALWMELLNRMTPHGETVTAWVESAQRADAHLNLLRNSKTGLYQVSRGARTPANSSPRGASACVPGCYGRRSCASSGRRTRSAFPPLRRRRPPPRSIRTSWRRSIRCWRTWRPRRAVPRKRSTAGSMRMGRRGYRSAKIIIPGGWSRSPH